MYSIVPLISFTMVLSDVCLYAIYTTEFLLGDPDSAVIRTALPTNIPEVLGTTLQNILEACGFFFHLSVLKWLGQRSSHVGQVENFLSKC